jgi:S1-C subfamily serine protease
MKVAVALLQLLFAQLGIAQTVSLTEPGNPPPAVTAFEATKLAPGEISAIVVDSTFQIFGIKTPGKEAVPTGTGFILGRTVEVKHSKWNQYLLFTAAHLFSDCAVGNDVASIRFRFRDAENPLKWRLEDRQIKIADAGRPLWFKHPTAEVAVLAIDLPGGVIKTVLPIEVLATKQTLMELYVGRNVLALGYPFGALGLSGFPILRPAEIASRAIEEKGTFALSFQIYPGDSGGPVYSIEQTEKGFHIVIFGLMVQALAMKANTVQSNGGLREILTFVGVGYVAPSTELLEAANLVPSRKK